MYKIIMKPLSSTGCPCRHPTSRRRRLPLRMLAWVSIIISCLAACHGFQTAGPSSTGRSRIPHTRTPSIQPLPLIIKSNSEKALSNIRHGISGSGTRSDSGGLFPRRKALARSMSPVMMSTDDDASGGEVSTEKSPLVKVWMSIRKLLARLWNLLMKPFQLLKSILTKVDNDKDITETKEEAIQEEVAITEVENIAAVEEDQVASTEEEQTKADEVEVVQKTVPVPSEASSEESPDAAKTPRQATATTNLSGNWTLIVDDAFTSQYDDYLRKLGQPALVRGVALTVIGTTTEETMQSENGQRLFIRGMNVRGSWERELEASEQMVDDLLEGERENVHAVEGHVLKPMSTADGEDVEVASWWEDNGMVHHSWVVGGKKYGGGDFENKRYLTDDGNILVCESTFHPKEEGREKACVTWRFLREGAIYGDAALQLPNIFDVLKKDEKESTTEDDNVPKAGVVVGDIMDDVATSSTTDDAAGAMIEEAIERESWVPPLGDRWAISAPDVDLTGKWKLIITEQFKKDYEHFLRSLGQPLIVRGAAVVLIGNTREETTQSDGGRTLYVKGINAKGIWERTLTSSGSDFDSTMEPNVDGSYDHILVPIETADSERVKAESWWESDGTVHVSWTRGVTRYGGGSFESKRYLENDGNVYVCESTFHPNDPEREQSFLRWKFLREGSAFMLAEK